MTASKGVLRPSPASGRRRAAVRLSCLLLLTAGVAAAEIPAAFAPAPGRLAYWGFNEPGFATDDGRAPSLVRGVTNAPSLDGQAASFANTNGLTVLRYRVVEADGRTNFCLPTGSLRFLVQPNWSSSDPMALPGYGWGRGPTQWARLFEIADTNGAPLLALTIDPAGSNLVIQARGTDGVLRTNFQTRIVWTRMQSALRRPAPLPWHEVAVSYSRGGTLVVVDGNQMQDWQNQRWAGKGVAWPDSPAGLSFCVGASFSGDWPAQGLIDELETYDRLITPLDLYQHRASTVLSAAVTASPPSVSLRWFSVAQEPATVRRRLVGDSSWITLTNRLFGFSFVDTSAALRLGERYEYEVGPRNTTVSLAGRPQDDRGRVIVLVEEGVASGLTAQLEQLRSDLVGDGWTVLIHEAPRHPDNAWNAQAINPRYVTDLARTKALIQADYAAAPADTKAVLIIGHVTIPYSGVNYEDGHWEMNGAWPADSYYGDVDGRWSDSVMNTGANLRDPARRNVPGDGKLDANNFKQYITTPGGENGLELAVGRIDFARLPAFKSSSELALLRQYLAKDHRYRMKEIRFEHAAIAGAYFSGTFSGTGQSIYLNALATGTRLGGLDQILHGNAFQGSPSALWAFQGGYGANDTLHNNRADAAAQGVAPVTTALLATSLPEPHIAFYQLKGSYFGDWNLADNGLLRALLATPNYGLAACWTMNTIWHFENLGVGEPLGDGLVRTARSIASTRTTFILGDPTLRAQVTAPPSRVSGRKRPNGAVELRWGLSAEASAGYFIYRSVKGYDGPFEKVTAGPVTGAAYLDADAPAAKKLYQVRAAQQVVTGSGAFTNLSQAAFVTVE